MQTAFRFLWRSDTRHIPTFLSNVQYFSMSQREQEWAYCVNAKLCLFKLTGWISALPLCLSPSRGFSACQTLLLTILENRGREKSVLVNSLSQLPSSAVSLRTAGLFFFFFLFWDAEELWLSCQLHCVPSVKACNTRGPLKTSKESVAIGIQQKFLLQSTLPVNAGS